MFKSKLPKEPTKAEMQKKVEAWKTINSVLVSANAKYMENLHGMLAQKEQELQTLEKTLQGENATEDMNAEYLFLGGYVQCLKDILNAKKGIQNQ